ncbi:TPA: relaxase/mobilization nuclease domain-containing protein [Streptococcus suis]
MVVSSIKPIKKSIGAYENYIFGKAHNNKKERNLVIFGVGNCKDLAPEDMVKALKYERESFLSSKRKHDAYTLVIAFSDELNPNNPNDIKKAEKITREIVETAYPNRSAMIAIQRDGKGGLLHAHVLLNNVDANGKALRQTGWKHLKRSTDMVTIKNGLTPLTEKRESNTHYDWRRDLAFNIRETCGDFNELADIGITMRTRKSKKYPPVVTSFAFTDRDGKKRNIRGRQLAKQLDLPSDYFDISNLEQLKQDNLNMSHITNSKNNSSLLTEELELISKQNIQELNL